jgi:hypothetical protein
MDIKELLAWVNQADPRNHEKWLQRFNHIMEDLNE